MSSASPPQRLLLTGLVMSCLGVAFRAFGVVTAMPDVMRDLDGVAFYAWAFTTFVIAMLFATVVAGRACDRVGVAETVARRVRAVLCRPATRRRVLIVVDVSGRLTPSRAWAAAPST